MTREEAIADFKEEVENAKVIVRAYKNNGLTIKNVERTIDRDEMAISALSKNKGEWIPVEKCGYPKPEDEYKHFLTIDNKGEITIQEFLLSLDEEPQPYFTGMRNIVAWQPLPEPYKKGE